MSESSYATAKRRVEGAGSAHHGAGTWIKERVSSVALVPLTLWALWSAATVAGSGWEGVAHWLTSPWNAILLALLIVVSLYHMQLGLRVVVEDYIHRRLTKALLLTLNVLFCVALGFIAIFAILKVAVLGAIAGA